MRWKGWITCAILERMCTVCGYCKGLVANLIPMSKNVHSGSNALEQEISYYSHNDCGCTGLVALCTAFHGSFNQLVSGFWNFWITCAIRAVIFASRLIPCRCVSESTPLFTVLFSLFMRSQREKEASSRLTLDSGIVKNICPFKLEQVIINTV